MKVTPAWVIQKKRDGHELSAEEISGFIEGLSAGAIPDYQATAFLMAVFFRGMTLDETVALTRAMLESGLQLDLSDLPGSAESRVDKHSTGGVGDKVSLILAPLAAACGLVVPMMAGRGLGHSGGTIDKLESIPGYRAQLSESEFKAVLRKAGCVIASQSDQIAPADKKLYALRDVTATVECVPLIVASILSKKLAEGARALVMDVKVGSGAFMKTRTQAKVLGKTLASVAKKLDLPCRVLITDMNQPLGYAAGNALEVAESIAVLRNAPESKAPKAPLCCGSADLRELTLQLCAHMLELGKITRNTTEGRKLAEKRLKDGSAWMKFLEMIEAQGGSIEPLMHPEKLPSADLMVQWNAPKRGYLSGMDTEEIGKILVELGAGRKRAADPIDPAVGMVFHKKLGVKVAAGEPIVTVHARKDTDLAPLKERFMAALEITTSRKAVPKLVQEKF